MNDSISRQEVIDALDAICERECEYSKPQRAVMCGACRLGSAFDAVDELPPAERKKGKWIEDAETYYKAVNKKGGGVNEDTPYFTESNIGCSECLAMFNVIDNETERFDFCPNCGADMRGEEG